MHWLHWHLVPELKVRLWYQCWTFLGFLLSRYFKMRLIKTNSVGAMRNGNKIIASTLLSSDQQYPHRNLLHGSILNPRTPKKIFVVPWGRCQVFAQQESCYTAATPRPGLQSYSWVLVVVVHFSVIEVQPCNNHNTIIFKHLQTDVFLQGVIQKVKHLLKKI